ncbi:Small RNA 2'-O-methyltransferase [Mortierella sp. AD094]|nr:Small RNA 2'-O-methyltransferase [Mortierella sp. AD094]
MEDISSQDSAILMEMSENSQEASFFPALWQQRRNLAFRVIGESQATSVIDYGCGEGALLSFLIWETTGDYPITRLAGVDIIHERLKMAEDACQPQDFELGTNLRVNDLSIELYRGSVAEADQRLLGYDALACLEVVEHLDPEVLEKFWSVVLGTLKPKLVIVSTPNAEFNIYFPQLKYGTPEAIFRNDDHRFEWTRQEFEDWCRPAAEEYRYTVSFTGVGTLAHTDPAVGFCSQFAIFRIQEDSPLLNTSLTASECHSPVAKIQYPTYSEIHSEEEILEYLLNKIAYIRPRLPEPVEEDDYYTWTRDNDSNSIKLTHTDILEEKKPNEKPQEADGTEEEKVDEENRVELGIIDLDDLWLALDVRQRCKNRSRMIKILGMSTLVRLNLEEGKVRFDEEDEFWKEYDRQNKASELNSQSSTGLGYGSEFDQDEYYDQVGYDYDQEEVHCVDVNYGEQNGGWDMDNWSKSAEADDVEAEDSPWKTPAVEPTASTTDPWNSP